MSDSIKPLLRDDADDFERALLGSGLDAETPPEGARARAMAALGLSSPAAVDAPPPATSSAPSGVLAQKWILLAAVVVVGSAAIGVSTWQSDRAPENRTPSSSASGTASAAPPAPVSNDEPGPAVEHVSAPAEPPAISAHALPNAADRKTGGPGARRAAETPSEAAPGSPPSDDALARETALIDDARRAVAAGDAARALALLEIHDREFRRGVFQLDAGVLRIEALERAGRAAEAERLAHDFLARHPAGSYARRARAALDRIEGTNRGPARHPQ